MITDDDPAMIPMPTAAAPTERVAGSRSVPTTTPPNR
jgi:hypothetical protein